MSKLIYFPDLVFFALSLCATAQNQPKCSKGYQPFGDGCVTQRMFDYISCVTASGANRQEITEEINQAASRQLSGQAKGEGSGAIVHGAGGVALNANSEKELVKKIQQKWYSDAMKQCANVLASPQKKPSDQPPKKPPVSDDKASSSTTTPAVGSVNQGSGSALSINQQGGVTAGTYVSDVFPRPGVTPNVQFCTSELANSIIKITTDVEITAPFWALVFDGPVTGATIDMEDANHEPFGYSAEYPKQWPLGQLTEPLGGFPKDSRLFISADDNTRVLTDNVLRVQINEIGNPFGGPYRPWGPKDHLRIKVKSAQSVHLIAIASGYGQSFLSEHMTVACSD